METSSTTKDERILVDFVSLMSLKRNNQTKWLNLEMCLPILSVVLWAQSCVCYLYYKIKIHVSVCLMA